MLAVSRALKSPAVAAAIRGAAAMLVAATLAACDRRPSSVGADASRPDEEACRGVPVQGARCYRVSVPENRSVTGGRTLRLRVVVLPALGGATGEPVFQLAGGPGQAATGMLYDPSLAASALRQGREFVLADQRGTGDSNGLNCRFYGPPDDAQSYFREFLPIEKVKECRAALQQSADLTQYTTAASVEDLEAIRAAFGYQRLSLIGGSYGTRLAMEYVRRHEDRVRTVVLEGPVTPRLHPPERFGVLAQRALDGLIEECFATPPCAQAYPRLREETAAVFERLRGGPVTASVMHPDSTRRMDITLTRDHVGEAIRYLMYSSAGASRVPEVLHQAFGGNYSPIAQFLIRWRAEGTFDGLYLSITCAEDVPRVAADAAELDDATYLGGYRVRQQRAACAEWPRGTAPPDSVEPVKSPVPTLIISGTLDPVTPPENGDEIAATLPNSLNIRVPAGGHSPAGLSHLDCLDAIKRDFITRASVNGLDTSCVSGISRPPMTAIR
jgi:pimeloyl-ACP methyl ester carboxylesterase